MKFLNDLTFIRTTGIDFTTSTSDVRKLFWDEDNHTLSIEMGGNIIQQIGEEQFVMAKNLTASLIPNGALVSTIGSLGETGRAIIEPSLGSGPYDASCISGLVTEDIAAGGDGIVTSFGLVRNMNTTGASVGETWAEGDKLYVHPTVAGAMTNVLPQAPNLKVFIGRVMYVDSINGSIFVCVQRGSYLGQDHNVEFTNLLDGELIQYNDVTKRWENISVESLSFNASQSLVEDIGNYYTGNNIEVILQEIGYEIVDLKNKLYNSMSTGVTYFTGLSLVDSTHFNVGQAIGYIVDNETDPDNPIVTKVNYPGGLNLTTPYLTTNTVTHVYIDKNSQLLLSPGVYSTDQEHRQYMYLGRVAHPNQTTIVTVANAADVFISPTSQLRDLWHAIGMINDGVSVYPRNGDLSLSLNGGVLHANGINYYNDRSKPNELSIDSEVLLTFGYRTQTGAGADGLTALQPGYYDNNGVVTAFPANPLQATNQYVFLAISGRILVQYGQHIYSKFEDAVAAVGIEEFNVLENLKENAILIGVITVARNATDLSNPAQAKFTKISKFGILTGGAGGGGIGASNAADVAITDSGNYYTSSNVEGALQEIGNSLANVVDTNDTSSVVAGTSISISSAITGSNTEYTVNHADTSTLSGAQGTNGIASISVDGLGHVTSVTPATYLTSETPDFNTIVITDSDSGYTWSETGSIVADQVNDSATFVSGTGIDLDVSSSADAIRISNAGVTSAVSGTGVNVSSATGAVTFSHGDTSTQASVNNSGNTFIQDVVLDDYGHITSLVSGTVVESNAFSNIAVSGQNTIAADSTADTLTLIAGDNTTITTDSVNDSVTINSVDTVTRVSGTAGTPVSGDVLVQGTGLISTSQSGNTITIATTANNYSHPTQTVIASDNSSGTVIQDISVNTLGHVTSVGTVNLDGRYYTETEVDNLLSAKQSTSEKGVANGYASLDAAGLVPASQLPSYVDDVLEYATLEDFPTTGTAGKIYIALDTNKTYRWSGTVYVYITSGAVDSVDGRTGVVSLSSVYEPKNTNIQTHISSTSNPHGVTATQVGLGNVTNESKSTMFASPTFTGTPVAPTAAVNTDTTQLATTAFVNAEIANDAAPKSHVGATGTAHGVATTSVNGFMSSSDFTKLSGVATNANNYVHPTTTGNKHIPAGGSTGKVLGWDSDGTAVWSDPSGSANLTLTTLDLGPYRLNYNGVSNKLEFIYNV